MTTTASTSAPPSARARTSRPPVSARPRTPSRAHRNCTTAAEVRGARIAAAALLALTILAVPSVAVLVTTDSPDGTVAHLLGFAFLTVAVLDIVAAWGLHLVLRRHATPASTAGLVSRCGYAALLTGPAILLAWPGGAGTVRFAEDWSLALLVFALHLVIAGTALWRSRIAPWWMALTLALAGVTYLLGDSVARMAGTDASAVLVPLLLGELVLLGWLLHTGRRGAAAA